MKLIIHYNVPEVVDLGPDNEEEEALLRDMSAEELIDYVNENYDDMVGANLPTVKRVEVVE